MGLGIHVQCQVCIDTYILIFLKICKLLRKIKINIRVSIIRYHYMYQQKWHQMLLRYINHRSLYRHQRVTLELQLRRSGMNRGVHLFGLILCSGFWSLCYPTLLLTCGVFQLVSVDEIYYKLKYKLVVIDLVSCFYILIQMIYTLSISK